MGKRVAKLSMLALMGALLFTGVGCGDDDDDGAGGVDGGTAGTSAGTGGTGGAGTGGADAGGDAVAACIAATPATVPSACAQCLCENETEDATTCAEDAMCWNLIECVATMCGDQAQGMCVMDPAGACYQYSAGSLEALRLNSAFTGACASACPMGSDDAGVDDAGN